MRVLESAKYVQSIYLLKKVYGWIGDDIKINLKVLWSKYLSLKIEIKSKHNV